MAERSAALAESRWLHVTQCSEQPRLAPCALSRPHFATPISRDGPGGKTGNIVGYGIVCVGIPIGDSAFVKRFLELKEEEIFDKIDRTVELLGPSQSFTGFQLASKCLNPMLDYLGRGMDANAYTLPTFTRFDAKMLNAVAKLIGQGEEWPTDGTAHLGRDAWELAKERLRIPRVPRDLEGWASLMQRQNAPWEESPALLIVFGVAWERRIQGTKGPVTRHLLAYRFFPPPYLTR